MSEQYWTGHSDLAEDPIRYLVTVEGDVVVNCEPYRVKTGSPTHSSWSYVGFFMEKRDDDTIYLWSKKLNGSYTNGPATRLYSLDNASSEEDA